MLTVYTFLSHTCQLLPYQLAAIKKNVPVSRVVVVQGPYGRGFFAGGEVRLQSNSDVDILEVPDDFLGLSAAPRFHEILKWLWKNIVTQQPEEHALIIHGDLLPVSPVDINILLDGHPVAGRRHLTWMLANLKECGDWNPSMIPDKRFRSWEMEAGDFGTEVGGPWMHVNKMSFVPWQKNTFELQLAGVDATAKTLGWEVRPACCETVPNLKPVSPKISMLHGAAGIAKAALGIDRPPDDVVAMRRAACESCEHNREIVGFRQCGLCLCVIDAKVVVSSEKCPAGKW